MLPATQTHDSQTKPNRQQRRKQSTRTNQINTSNTTHTNQETSTAHKEGGGDTNDAHEATHAPTCMYPDCNAAAQPNTRWGGFYRCCNKHKDYKPPLTESNLSDQQCAHEGCTKRTKVGRNGPPFTFAMITATWRTTAMATLTRTHQENACYRPAQTSNV